jgi:hypothetical protein
MVSTSTEIDATEMNRVRMPVRPGEHLVDVLRTEQGSIAALHESRPIFAHELDPVRTSSAFEPTGGSDFAVELDHLSGLNAYVDWITDVFIRECPYAVRSSPHGSELEGTTRTGDRSL